MKYKNIFALAIILTCVNAFAEGINVNNLVAQESNNSSSEILSYNEWLNQLVKNWNVNEHNFRQGYLTFDSSITDRDFRKFIVSEYLKENEGDLKKLSRLKYEDFPESLKYKARAVYAGLFEAYKHSMYSEHHLLKDDIDDANTEEIRNRFQSYKEGLKILYRKYREEISKNDDYS